MRRQGREGRGANFRLTDIPAYVIEVNGVAVDEVALPAYAERLAADLVAHGLVRGSFVPDHHLIA